MKCILKNCANKDCGKEFIPSGNRQLYCNPNCMVVIKSLVSIKNAQESFKSTFEEKIIYTVRICLNCQNKFKSEGKYNRICAPCKRSHEYATQEEPYNFK